MRMPSFFSTQRWAVLLLGCAFVIAFSDACGGKVAVDKPSGAGGTGGTGGVGGAGGLGGGPSDSCEDFGGPVNPAACKTEGATCAFGDTSCFKKWTCHGGIWAEEGSCF